MRVLVVNAGSSSLKLRLLDAQDTVSRSADLPDGADACQSRYLSDQSLLLANQSVRFL